ncbi:MAG: hypothetical protein ABSB22_08470 [Thermodesulfobacteriota bacterium]
MSHAEAAEATESEISLQSERCRLEKKILFLRVLCDLERSGRETKDEI